MSLMLFAQIYQELALAETRSIQTRGASGLPDDEYSLLEAYCPDPECDCRRVMLNVISRRDVENRPDRYLASISFGFDRDDEFAGPMLDPLNSQSQYAETLLELTERLLADPAYVGRLKKHYRMVKKAIHDPDPAIRQKITHFMAEEEAMWGGATTKPARLRSEKKKPRASTRPASGISGKDATLTVSGQCSPASTPWSR
jgi:hypothetical protein